MRRHVERDTTVRQRQAGDVVPAALDRQLELVVPDELDGAHDVLAVLSARTTTAGRFVIIPFQRSVASAKPSSSG